MGPSCEREGKSAQWRGGTRKKRGPCAREDGNRQSWRAQLGPSREREGNPCKRGETGKQRKRAAGTAGHGWGPRASARGTARARGETRCGGARNPASLRAFHFRDFPPALAGGSPPGLVLNVRFSLRISSGLGQRGNAEAQGEKRRRAKAGTVGGPRASARGNPQNGKGKPANREEKRKETWAEIRGHGGAGLVALARARGETRK